MLRQNKARFLVIFTVLVLSAWLLAQQPAQPVQPVQAQPPAQQPTQPMPQADQAQSANQPQGHQPVLQQRPGEPTSADQGQEPTKEGDTFIFRKEVEEVRLSATVQDQKARTITDLDKSAFTVFEDGVPQNITSLQREDIPVSIGILVDNSGSMRDKRPAVTQAVINLVKASNPQDEAFVVNFNDEPFIDQDFTNSIPKMKEALEKIESRGGTAFYDAVVASADHLAKGSNPKIDKKVLLVVTDGEDNMSRESLEQAIQRVQSENGPVVYTIGILGEDREAKRAKRALRAIALETGGVAFFPRDLSEVDSISQAVAHDIRNQYTIIYKPKRPMNQGGYRTVKVEAHAGGYGKLTVRTRSGYYPEQIRAAK